MKTLEEILSQRLASLRDENKSMMQAINYGNCEISQVVQVGERITRNSVLINELQMIETYFKNQTE